MGIPKVKSNFLLYTNKRKTLNASRNVPHGGILGPSAKFNPSKRHRSNIWAKPTNISTPNSEPSHQTWPGPSKNPTSWAQTRFEHFTPNFQAIWLVDQNSQGCTPFIILFSLHKPPVPRYTSPKRSVSL